MTVCLSLGVIAVSGFGICYAGQPHVLNINGPTPLLEFEVKPPVGQSLENSLQRSARTRYRPQRNARLLAHQPARKSRRARRLRRALFPHFATPFRAEISQRRGPNFPTQAAGRSDEGEISRLVRLAKPGFCSEKSEQPFVPLAQTSIRFATKWIIRTDKLECCSDGHGRHKTIISPTRW